MDLQDKGRFDSRVGQTSLASEERWRKLEPETFADRFWSYVEKTPLCWLWVGALDAHGYGQLTVHAYPFRAHRLAWLLAHGSIPLRAHILHRCDVRRCVNPNHLFLGDQAANMKDAAEKGRLHVGRPGRRRLSDEAMQDILAAQPERGVCRRLAAQHSVSMSYVSLLRRGLRGWVGEEKMSDFVRTMELLRQGGVPTRMVDPATVSFWLDKGYSPEQIAAQIFSVGKERAS